MDYVNLFPKAWKNVLDAIEEGLIFCPGSGEESNLRCHLFSECLSILRKEVFPKPYLIFSEQRIGNRIADLAFGKFKEKNLVAVELKCFPSMDKLLWDVLKIDEYVKEGIQHSFFAMLSDSSLMETLEDLDKFKKGEFISQEWGWIGSYKWRSIEPRYPPFNYLNNPVESLIISYQRKL